MPQKLSKLESSCSVLNTTIVKVKYELSYSCVGRSMLCKFGCKYS